MLTVKSLYKKYDYQTIKYEMEDKQLWNRFAMLRSQNEKPRSMRWQDDKYSPSKKAKDKEFTKDTK